MVILSDLRINNIVTDGVDTFIVSAINSLDKKIICSTFDLSQILTFTPEQLYYVKLDVNWLKRFRFSFGLKSNRRTIYADGWFSPHLKGKNEQIFKIRLYQEAEEFVFALDSDLGVSFKYVHEVQNIYKAISKKELPFLANDNKSFVKIL